MMVSHLETEVSPLRKLAHAIYEDYFILFFIFLFIYFFFFFFSAVKIENFIENFLIFSLFLLKTLIVSAG